jgi:hypothetical protein
METPPTIPNADAENLKLLAIFHYVVGGIGFLFACIPLLHVALGLFLIAAPSMSHRQAQDLPPAIIGYLFAGFAGMMVLLGWTMAVCTILSGRKIAQRKNRMFSVVVGAVLCMFMPFGTVLGIFTLIVLSKESVQRLYAA